MRKWVCVPMMTLCLLLTACSKTREAEMDLRAAYQEMTACEMTTEVRCGVENLEWNATLQCKYDALGKSTVEVIAPAELAGVRAVIDLKDCSLEYGDLCLNIGTLSDEEISPAACPVRLMEALRQGWLLEENEETWQGEICMRLKLDQSGGKGDIVSTIWLRKDDGLPIRGEIAVNGENILTVEFTEFSFCDTIKQIL